MKRSGLLNAPLAAHLARLGHTDRVVIADCGLPVPTGVPRVDLALTFGIPPFTAVLDALLAEIVVERTTAASEITGRPVALWLAERRDSLGPLDLVPHDRLKHIVATSSVVVRTGEASPYANVILHCGVPF